MADHEETIGIRVLDDGATETLAKLDKALGKVDKEVADLGKTSKKSEKAVGGLEDELDDLTKTSKKSKEALDKLAKANKKVGKTAKKAEKETFDFGKGIEGLGLASGEHLGNIAFLAGAVGAAFFAAIGTVAVGAMTKYLETTEEGRIATEGFTKAQKKLNLALGEVLVNSGEATKTIGLFTIVMNDLTTEIERDGSDIADVWDAISTGIDFVINRMTDAVSIGLTFPAVVADFFRGWFALMQEAWGFAQEVVADLGEALGFLDKTTADTMRTAAEFNQKALDKTLATSYTLAIWDARGAIKAYKEETILAAGAQDELNKKIAISFVLDKDGAKLSKEERERVNRILGGVDPKPKKTLGAGAPKKKEKKPLLGGDPFSQTINAEFFILAEAQEKFLEETQRGGEQILEVKQEAWTKERAAAFEHAVGSLAIQAQLDADQLRATLDAINKENEEKAKIAEKAAEEAAEAAEKAAEKIADAFRSEAEKLAAEARRAADEVLTLEKAFDALAEGGLAAAADSFSGMLSMMVEGKSTMRDYVEFGMATFGAFFESLGRGWLLAGIASGNVAQAIAGGALMVGGALMKGGASRRGGAGAGAIEASNDRQTERESFRRQSSDPDNKEVVQVFNIILDGEAINTAVSRANSRNFRRGETSTDSRRF